MVYTNRTSTIGSVVMLFLVLPLFFQSASAQLTGKYYGSGTTVWSECRDAGYNGSYPFTLIFKISEKSGDQLRGGATSQVDLSGSVGSDRAVFKNFIALNQSKMIGDFSSNFFIDGVYDSSSTGNFTVDIIDQSLHVIFNGKDVVGDSCNFRAIATLNKMDESSDCAAADTSTPGRLQKGCIITSQGKRYYHLYLPKKFNRSDSPDLPLVIGLHGGGGNPTTFSKYSRLNQAVEKMKSKAIMVYPEGYNKHWNDGRPGLYQDRNDVEFLSSLIDHIAAIPNLSIDSKRVFITGISNGGLMPLRFACERPELLAGAAVVASVTTNAQNRICTKMPDQRALPIAFIFGTKDTSFLDNGKMVNPVRPNQVFARHIGIGGMLDYWKKRNSCPGRSKTFGPFDINKKDHSRVFLNTFLKCQKQVHHYQIEGGGHRWPDFFAKNNFLFTKVLNLGYASKDISSGKRILGFFMQQ